MINWWQCSRPLGVYSVLIILFSGARSINSATNETLSSVLETILEEWECKRTVCYSKAEQNKICDDKHRGKQNIIYVNRNGVLVYWSTLRIQLFNCKSQLPVHTCKSYPHSKHTEAWFKKPWKLKNSIFFLKRNNSCVQMFLQ